MKKNAVRLSITTFALLVLAACSTPVPKQTDVGTDQGTAPTGNNGIPTATMNVDPTALPPEVANAHSVYFDYDSYIVKDDSRPVIVTNANFLKKSGRHVILQGNTDERGGSEFNLALGQKRAEAVRKQLTLLGVPDGQLEAVSFGKEKPMAQGHDEAAWAQNRRVDFSY
jgi:peptidoglycan-associated lipoprotein